MDNLLWLTIAALAVSFLFDRHKTYQALKRAYRKFVNILPAFFEMLMMVSIVLFLLPDHVIAAYLGGEYMARSVVIAAFFGSVTMMPGFIAFPLGGLLLDRGVSYTVIASFTTTLMMVGVLTFPIERNYFGTRLTLVRNGASFVLALVVALVIGMAYGEVPLW